jgi:CRISPR-associated endonuclease/helicase Cas3
VLSPDDFSAFFEEVHGCTPFPWQTRLQRQVAASGEWPSVLDLPTGSGKTAAIDIAIFHLALEADRGEARRAPVRIAFVVDRRLVVDDAFMRALKLEKALATPRPPVTARVVERLKKLSGDGPALIARRLRGGIPREDDWARTPSQPTVLCSTVDQIGSRLLFRGYGVSDSMKPVHAGLIGSDCLILLDEAHLAEPLRQTLEWVHRYRGQNWREAKTAAPWGVALLTATPGERPQDAFPLEDEDKLHSVLGKRLNVSKPARLVGGAKVKAKAKAEEAANPTDDETEGGDKDLSRRTATIVKEVHDAIDHFNGAPSPAIGVVVNRIARARAVFKQLTEMIGAQEAECLLLIGPARPVDRDNVANQLAPIRTGAERTLEKPLILVATQCIEAGVDIDLDALITEAAPLDALRQRFGRLNRAGRDIVPYSAIVAAKSDVSGRAEDPVYGKAIKPAWERLMEAAGKDGSDPIVEFGLQAFTVRMEADALAGKADAPVLLPAHLDLLSQTSPIPAADPEVSLYLHGTSRQPDSIIVIWRADIAPERHRDEDIRRLLMLVPPRSFEAIELPLWAVRRWLMQEGRTLAYLADIATTAPEEEERARPRGEGRKVFRWKGSDERSCWINPAALRPGDTIIVPAHYGGVDEFGWNPDCQAPATDGGRKAAEPFAGRRFAVRVAPGLFDASVTDEALADALAGAASERWQDLRVALTDLDLPEDVRKDLAALDDANRRKSVTAYLDLYGEDDDRPRGVVFVAPFGIKGRKEEEEGRPNTTEDDTIGSIFSFPLSLQQHSRDVERKAEDFARAAGLPAGRVADLKLAGFLHDEGKRDPRFQAWLRYGDPLGPDPHDTNGVLAKSGRSLPRAARAASGLPENWRHEALSVRLARMHERLRVAHDPDLVLWLIGSHHGHGRPFFPHRDPTEQVPDVGPQSLAFDWNGLDWPSLFARLKARYGVWELARMEAILRLADHRASEERAMEGRE